MKKIHFTKMVASGNDFIVIFLASYADINLAGLARKICNRRYGIGADGLLVLEKSNVADIKMRIFNADGSEAEMCGNGARCASLYLKKENSRLETKAGIIQAKVNNDRIKIRLTDPRAIKLNIPLKLNRRLLKVNFINTGVPHAVILVEGLDKIDIVNLGRQIRNHRKFRPAGTNVDFIEAIDGNAISVRTYERGVEDETLACGTGSVAAALIFVLQTKTDNNKILVHTRSQEVLGVYFVKGKGGGFANVWLEGKAQGIFRGDFIYQEG